ncbi:hypothetical protein DFP72DRAFT_911370 [Ephemerocybe angulata]|uniref:F-box domain-containing protein n=1 Tax=Ephemerocybe angulata TaxID=980116 RepID=A0A8H6M0V0_9AGAR|nr:hypothetical protein DFP72DRAFT_911370 [Tulosesus angulatus]
MSDQVSIQNILITPSTSIEPRKKTVEIPVEILELIINAAYESHLRKDLDRWEPVSLDSLAHSSTFPTALSRVCTLWDAVLAPHPEYWTRIVVYLNERDHFRRLRLALERSQPNHISITILHSSGSSSLDGDEERVVLERVLSYLWSANHTRARSLSVRATSSASFASLPAEMVQFWPGLRELNFESQRWETTSTSDRETSLLPPRLVELAGTWKIAIENLTDLSLVGHMFVQLSRSSHGTNALRNAPLDSLAITRLRGSDGGKSGGFTFHELVRACSFTRVRKLALVDVDVPFEVDGQFTHWIHHNPLRRDAEFVFDGVANLTLRAFQQHLRRYTIDGGFRSQTFRNMQTYFGMFRTWGKVCDVEVTEVWGVESSDALACFFGGVDSVELRVIDCPGLTDVSLESIGPVIDMYTLEDTPIPPLDSMTNLVIVDCPNWTVEGLKGLVTRRKAADVSIQVEKGDHIEVPIAEIGYVEVRGKCPSVSNEDREWFAENGVVLVVDSP